MAWKQGRRTARQRGNEAEELALAHLRDHGLRLLARNWRIRAGELDLIMEQAQTVVFVEVRYRGSSAWSDGAASVDTRKQQRLIHAAQAWLQHHGADRPCRFDVISVSSGNNIEWIVNAFEA